MRQMIFSLIIIISLFRPSFAAVLSNEAQFALNDLNNTLQWTPRSPWVIPFSTDFNSSTLCEDIWPGISCSSITIISINLRGYAILGGTIPRSIGFLSNLQILNLNGLHLNGTIPSTVAGLTSLVTLNLGNNALSGTIPYFLVNPNLQELTLSSNLLSGRIPKIKSSVLNILNLDNNLLNGTIPPHLASYPFTLGQPQLQMNTFSGCIPKLLNSANPNHCSYANSPTNDFDCLCYTGCDVEGPCSCGPLGVVDSHEKCSSNPSTLIYSFKTPPLKAEFLQIGELLYFSCDISRGVGSPNYELCVLNRTSVQTFDINLSYSSNPYGFISVNGTVLFFIVRITSDSGFSLVRQTVESTFEELVTGLVSPSALNVLSNKILFKTEGGKVLNEIDPVRRNTSVISRSITDAINDQLFVLGETAYYSKLRQLWSYNTQNGENQLCINSTFQDPAQFTNVGGVVYFTALVQNSTVRLLHKLVGQYCINLQAGTFIDNYSVRPDINPVVDPSNTIWFVIVRSNTLTVCGCGSTCSVVISSNLQLNSTQNLILRAGMTKVYLTNDLTGQIAYLSTEPVSLFPIALGSGKFTQLSIIQSKLLATYNNRLIGFDTFTNTVRQYPIDINPGTIFKEYYIPNQNPGVLVWNGGNLTMFFDIFNGCNSPNDCYLSALPKFCLPQLFSVYQCLNSLPSCGQNSTRIYNSCEYVNLCNTYNGMCGLGYNCVANPGLAQTCIDINECITSSPCGPNQTCNNTIGSYTCICNQGYILNGTGCVDLDECQIPGICSSYQNCVNLPGSYNCTCSPGYSYNGTNCVDDMLCDASLCGINSQCYKIPSGDSNYTCICLPGYNSNELLQCVDIDECRLNSSICGLANQCINTDGLYTCNCSAGYTLNANGTQCLDIDECKVQPPVCGPNSNCTNSVGNYSCSCLPGFFLNGTICYDIDECAINNTLCGPNSTCMNNPGNYTCVCNQGFNWNRTISQCVDINECNAIPKVCPNNNSICENTIGNYSCLCVSGFYLDVDGNCVDINECLSDPPPLCPTQSNCINIDGSYFCQCNPGYFMHNNQCADVNECELQLCSPYANCDNLIGNYTCVCKLGFWGDGKNCTDIDECKLPNNNETAEQQSQQYQNITTYPCPLNSTCVNSIGNYSCVCNNGYNGSLCTDIDECTLSPPICNLNVSFCQNTIGNYECICKDGYSLNGTTCLDINECLNNPCVNNSDCTNTLGGYLCKCKVGFRYETTPNGYICNDIDECTIVPPLCPQDIECVNTFGNFYCDCQPGFVWDGKNCSDLNECNQQNDCSIYADCQNTDGSYLCSCKKPQFVGDGYNCALVTNCSQLCGINNVNCTNTLNQGYNCTCLPGWDGNGTFCSDINECSKNPCDKNAGCTNTPGSYSCQCYRPYIGDGFKCILESPANTCNITSGDITESPCYVNISSNGAIIKGGTVYLNTPIIFASLWLESGSTILIDVEAENQKRDVEGEVIVNGNLVLEQGSRLKIIQGRVIVNGNLNYNGSIEMMWSNTFINVKECAYLGPQSNLMFNLTDSDVRYLRDDVYNFVNTSCVQGNLGRDISANYDRSDCNHITMNLITQSLSFYAIKSCEKDFEVWPFIVIGVVLGVVAIVVLIVLLVPPIRRKIFSPFRRLKKSESYQMGTKTSTVTTSFVHGLLKTEESGKGIPEIPQPPFTVVAIADYKATEPNQISIKRGEKYEVTRVDDGQYWYQSRGPGGKLGWFPAVYAKMEVL